MNGILLLDQNYLSIQTNQLDGDIRDIQQYGDIALLAALLPYYLISMLSHVLPETFIPITTKGIWTGGIALACSRLRRDIALGTRVWIFVLVCVGLAALWGVLAQTPLFLHFPAGQSEQAKAQKELLEVQSEQARAQKELLEAQKEQLGAQSEQLRAEKEQLDAQKVAREKNEDAAPHPPPKHPKRPVQYQ